eukprot:15204778-Heterocapsa_arctica.AAC.1
MQKGVKTETATSPKPAKRKTAKATSKKDVPRPLWADVEDEEEVDIDYINSCFPSLPSLLLPKILSNTQG